MKRKPEKQETASSSKPNTINPSIIISQPSDASQEVQSDSINTSTPIPQYHLSLYFHPPITQEEELPSTPRHSLESGR